MNIKIKILGWIHVALGGISLVAGLALCAGLWFSPDAESVEAFFYVAPAILMLAIFMLTPGLIGGIGLLRLQPWARLLMTAPHQTPPPRGRGPSRGYLGVMVAMAGVGAGFVIVIGAGFYLSGRPAPPEIAN